MAKTLAPFAAPVRAPQKMAANVDVLVYGVLGCFSVEGNGGRNVASLLTPIIGGSGVPGLAPGLLELFPCAGAPPDYEAGPTKLDIGLSIGALPEPRRVFVKFKPGNGEFLGGRPGGMATCPCPFPRARACSRASCRPSCASSFSLCRAAGGRRRGGSGRRGQQR